MGLRQQARSFEVVCLRTLTSGVACTGILRGALDSLGDCVVVFVGFSLHRGHVGQW